MGLLVWKMRKAFFCLIYKGLFIPKSRKDPLNFIQHRIYTWMFLLNQVVKIISRFKDSSIGWEELKPGIIKNAKRCVAMPLICICNLSFKRGFFPMHMKIANVVPIDKSENEHIFSNYRPVSVLPVFSKLFERLMCSRLIKRMNFITKDTLSYKLISISIPES